LKLLVISAPAPDPCRSAAGIAVAAVRRQHQVHWVGPAHYGCLEQAGITVHRQEHWSGAANGEACRAFDPADAQRAAAIAEALFEPICRVAYEARPDLILCDVEAAHGAIVAEKLRIPWASYSSGLFVNSNERRELLEQIMRPATPANAGAPAGITPERLTAERRLNRLRARHGLPARVNLDAVSDGLHLIFTTRSFEFCGAGLPRAARCLGSLFRAPPGAGFDAPAPDASQHGAGSRVYVFWPASGRDAAANLHRIRAMANDAGVAAAVETHVPIQKHTQRLLRPTMSCARAVSLSTAALAICNGDFDFVQESLASGVPLLVLPTEVHERAVGLRVVELGLGHCIDVRELTPEVLQGILSALPEHDGIRRGVDEFVLGSRVFDGAARGVRYLERFAESGATLAHSPEEERIRRLPEHPRRARSARLSEAPGGGVVIGSHTDQFLLADPATAAALTRIWRRLDGRESVEHLLDSWDGEEDMLQLLDWLSRRKLVEEGNGSERFAPATLSRYAAQISLFSHASAGSADHPRRGGPIFQEKLLHAKVGVVGTGVLGSALVRHLALIGVGELRVSAADAVGGATIDQGGWYGAEDAGRQSFEVLRAAVRAICPEAHVLPIDAGEELNLTGLDLVVVAQDNFAAEPIRAVGRACHAANVTWMSLRRVRWETEIGPSVIPGVTACFECFERRREAALLSAPERPRAFASMDAGHLHLPFGADLVALEVVKILTGFGDPASLGHVLVFSPMRMSLDQHRILRIPDCPLCAPRPARSEQTVWDSSVPAD
jgi:molybdopterin-synthase adenylyltransferase